MGWPANMAKGSGERVQGLQDAILASTALFTDTKTEAQNREGRCLKGGGQAGL